jgi:signal transduction histidine kinase
MNKVTVSILFFLAAFRSAAQDAYPYSIRQFTTENGLPSNGIKGMEWDEKTGFLWIATEAGVARYNGLDFTNFTSQNTPGLTHERMAFAVKNNNGDIYTADVAENILLVKTNSIDRYKYPEVKPVLGFKKRFYLGTTGNLLRSRLLSFMKKTGNSAWSNVFQLSGNSLIVITDERNFYHISEQQDSAVLLSIPELYKNYRAAVLNGFLVLTDNNRRFYIAKNNFRSFEPVKLVSSSGEMVQVKTDNFLLYYENGMVNPILFAGNKAWLLHYHEEKIEAELICSVVPSYSFIRFAQYSGKNKVLFIGTDSKGVIVINRNKLVPMKNTSTDIRERNAYYSQIELKNGNVLTNEAHIIGTGKKTPGPLPVKGKFDFSTYSSGDSLLWFVQYNNLYRGNLLHRYNYKTGETFVYSKIPPVQSNFAMTYASGQQYFSYQLGMGILKGDSLHYLFRPGANKKQQSASYVMLEFYPGILGVASCDGLILYDINKKTTDTLLKAFGYCIRTLWRFKDYIFIGSYGKGFYIWKNGKLKAMPPDKNNFLLYTHCFVPDNEGYCWISSNRGLFKAQLSDLIDAYENDRTQIYYHYFGKYDGMETTEMNGGCSPCALLMKNQMLSFPTMDGLLWVNPEEARPLLPEGNIYIDEFVAGDEKINTDSVVLKPLPFKERDLVIRLGFSSWCNKENIYLEYQLDKSGRWIPVDVNKGAFIRFNNLNPGKHRLIVRKLNGFGVNNYSYKEIIFTIDTPWSQRWWFYVLCGLFLFGIIALYLWVRTRQFKIRQRKLEKQVAEKTKELQQQNEILEKNNRIKTRLISIISHDIITPLKFVTVAGKNLLEKKKLMSEELQQETVQEMTNTSQELQLLSTNILNWIKYQNENRRMVKETFNLHEMVEQVLGILQSLARQKNLQVKNGVKEALMVHQYYEPLKILIYNLLTNAIHFTEQGTITVAAVENNGSITLSVKDTGVGMTSEQIDRLMADDVVITSANVDNKKGHGLGFLIIKDLLKTMGATIKIESQKEEGTEVSIKMEK